jgi:DNA-binding NtrC family response regulator
MPREARPAEPFQLVVLSGDQSRIVDLPACGKVSIGRGDGCDVRVRDPSVSRNHAIIHVGATIVIEDLGSANGTTIRDRADGGVLSETMNVRQLVRKKAELSVGDAVVLGAVCIVLRHAAAPEAGQVGDRFGDLAALDPAMRALYAQAERAAATPITILLLGETGAGKEVLARRIHALSPRSGKLFQAINCAALSDSLLESELFGHEKGAFTGALQARAGLFEAAAGGTVLLDEVGELPLPTQAKLLRVIEEKMVVRLGSSHPTPIDVRFLAATNRDLEADHQSGRFRQDLYFRLNGISLRVPPLRERRAEIVPLALRFLDVACRLIERTPAPEFAPECLAALRAYAWPGNVRELRNVVERAAILSAGPAIRVEDLPAHLARVGRPDATGAPPVEPVESDVTPDLATEIRSLERARIVEALERSGGVQTEAARALGISRRTLITRIEEYGLPRPRKRDGRSD